MVVLTKVFKARAKDIGTPTHPLLWGSTGILHMQYLVLIASPSPPLSISTLDSKTQFEYHHMGLFNALGFTTYNIQR